jgi:glycosyltransferase involved in cell wall biosynthesis
MSSSSPYFSIIIPSYNRANFLSQTIQSVLDQSFQDWECIVVDDGSTDNTAEVVNAFRENDHRIIYLHQENAERCIARNNGIVHSNGKYICFLDSDDLFLPNHLEVLHTEIKKMNEPTALFFTNAFDQNDVKVLSDRNCPDIGICSVQDYILQYTFNPARVAVHSSIMKEEQFDPQIPGLEDLDLWLRISLFFPILQIKQRTIIYNLHAESYTIGDVKRFEKELNYFRYIFHKPQMKGKLSGKSKRRLISMCHYHLAVNANLANKKMSVLYHAMSSFFLYTKGYNGKTTKTLLIMTIYSIPILGFFMKSFVKFVK